MIMSLVLGMYHFLEAVYISCNISKQKYTNQTSTLRMITCTFLLAAMPAQAAHVPLNLGVPAQLRAGKSRRADQESHWHKPNPFWLGFLG